jgi:hypothetical protein
MNSSFTQSAVCTDTQQILNLGHVHGKKIFAVLFREQRRSPRNGLEVFEEVSWCAEI